MQKPGRNVEMLRHMKSQAQAQDIPPAGYCGYITFDEMSVQVILFNIVLLVLYDTPKCSFACTYFLYI